MVSKIIASRYKAIISKAGLFLLNLNGLNQNPLCNRGGTGTLGPLHPSTLGWSSKV